MRMKITRDHFAELRDHSVKIEKHDRVAEVVDFYDSAIYSTLILKL